jgi:conjugal transfer pilus assembly protein TraW
MISSSANSLNLGTIGHSFEIAEEGFVTMIKKRLAKLDIEAKQEEFKKKVQDNINNPKAKFLPNTRNERIYYYDPTYIVPEDILLDDGSVLYEKGYRINPLDHIDFDQKLVFVNGDDKEKKKTIEWIKKNNLQKEKIILVSGSPIKFQEDSRYTNVYFDQFGELVKKFKIMQVPAVISQEGKNLKIMELKIDSKN